MSMEEDTLRIAFLSDMSTRVMFLLRAAELGHSRPTSIANIVGPRGIDLRSISSTYWHNFRQIIFKTSTCFNETQSPPERNTEDVILWMPKTIISQYEYHFNCGIFHPASLGKAEA